MERTDSESSEKSSGPDIWELLEKETEYGRFWYNDLHEGDIHTWFEVMEVYVAEWFKARSASVQMRVLPLS